jgi:sulfhydrogenase subunit alpha
VNCLIGGFGTVPSAEQLVRLRADLQQGMVDCERAVELWSSLPPTDFCRSSTAYAALRPPVDYGYYSGSDISIQTRGGAPIIPVEELHEHSRETTIAHSHARHSSFDGKPFMVGALARLTVNGEKLTRNALATMQQLGLALPSENPIDNNKAQLVELGFDIEYALAEVERFLNDGLQDEDPVSAHARESTGVAVTEAPRGLLYYQLAFDAAGRVTSANVITPTAFNASSVEDHFTHTVSQSRDKSTPELTRRLEMVARAYDPCISCSVHVLRRNIDT